LAGADHDELEPGGEQGVDHRPVTAFDPDPIHPMAGQQHHRSIRVNH
jgi:hypothetical protein